MHAFLSIAKAPNAQLERREAVAGGSEATSAVRQFFRPYVLAFVALATIYAGFIYGYKLSQYFQHREITRASLTRAWVDHRDDSIAVVSHEQVRPAELLVAAVFAVATLQVAHRTPDLILDEPTPAREAFLFSSLIPFRAPPSTNPSLS